MSEVYEEGTGQPEVYQEPVTVESDVNQRRVDAVPFYRHGARYQRSGSRARRCDWLRQVRAYFCNRRSIQVAESRMR